MNFTFQRFFKSDGLRDFVIVVFDSMYLLIFIYMKCMKYIYENKTKIFNELITFKNIVSIILFYFIKTVYQNSTTVCVTIFI